MNVPKTKRPVLMFSRGVEIGRAIITPRHTLDGLGMSEPKVGSRTDIVRYVQHDVQFLKLSDDR